MPREHVFVQEAITASERIVTLAAGQTAETLAADAETREAPLWKLHGARRGHRQVHAQARIPQRRMAQAGRS